MSQFPYLDLCPPYAPIFGFVGIFLCVSLGSFGAAVGTFTAGRAILTFSIRSPHSIMRLMLPVIMSGVLGVYALVVAVVIHSSMSPPDASNKNATTYSLYKGYADLAAGLCCGVSCLAAGLCIGTVGNVGVRAISFHQTTSSNQAIIFSHFNNRNRKANTKTTTTTSTNRDDKSSESTPLFEMVSPEQESISKKNVESLFVGMVVMLIFSEAIALYGMIVGVMLSQKRFACDNNFYSNSS